MTARTARDVNKISRNKVAGVVKASQEGATVEELEAALKDILKTPRGSWDAEGLRAALRRKGIDIQKGADLHHFSWHLNRVVNKLDVPVLVSKGLTTGVLSFRLGGLNKH